MTIKTYGLIMITETITETQKRKFNSNSNSNGNISNDGNNTDGHTHACTESREHVEPYVYHSH